MQGDTVLLAVEGTPSGGGDVSPPDGGQLPGSGRDDGRDPQHRPLIVVNALYDHDTEPYARYCFKAMQRMASTGARLKLRLHSCQGDPQWAADNHCAGIRESVKETAIEPAAVHIICDSDTVVVMPDWDLAVLTALETHDCIGTAYAPIGSMAAGCGRKQTYKDKPNVEWLALKPGKPWHRFDPARPGHGGHSIVVDSPEAEVLWGMKLGYEVLTDTCWNFPMFLRDYGLTSQALPNIEHRQYVALQGMMCYEEWHLDGVPFVVHQGKSRKNSFRGTAFSKSFYDRCDQLLQVRPPRV
jgi:hypothetical protein